MNKLVFSAVFLISIFVSAQSDPGSLLNKLQEKFESIDDLMVNFSQNTGAQKISGKLYYSDEDKLRIEFGNSILISDGRTNWNFNKAENKVIISSADESPGSALSIKTLLYDYPEKCTLSYEFEGNQNILILIPDDRSLNFRSVRLWINDSYLIDKVTVEDNFGNSTIISFSEYTLNSGIKDYIFSFQIPEGCTVIDLR